MSFFATTAEIIEFRSVACYVTRTVRRAQRKMDPTKTDLQSVRFFQKNNFLISSFWLTGRRRTRLESGFGSTASERVNFENLYYVYLHSDMYQTYKQLAEMNRLWQV